MQGFLKIQISTNLQGVTGSDRVRGNIFSELQLRAEEAVSVVHYLLRQLQLSGLGDVLEAAVVVLESLLPCLFQHG